MRLFEYLISVKGYSPYEASECCTAYEYGKPLSKKWYDDIMDFSLYDENEAYRRFISYYKD